MVKPTDNGIVCSSVNLHIVQNIMIWVVLMWTYLLTNVYSLAHYTELAFGLSHPLSLSTFVIHQASSCSHVIYAYTCSFWFLPWVVQLLCDCGSLVIQQLNDNFLIKIKVTAMVVMWSIPMMLPHILELELTHSALVLYLAI
jgi:hypothetical protein